ncbi:hypothetical protein [Pseudomarimonas arenosa]|uniref:Lipoprotein n=1 Tax=Pseudomarimonas arenosa TaxID=2774145 RepID=A0AAW3ZJZ0_9GAMM|nr:hypothetical protein [Pseudomarimonas arenosa]MBD8526428.1 hypothetical protein [Pseudomarimonas arenosa]
MPRRFTLPLTLPGRCSPDSLQSPSAVAVLAVDATCRHVGNGWLIRSVMVLFAAAALGGCGGDEDRDSYALWEAGPKKYCESHGRLSLGAVTEVKGYLLVDPRRGDLAHRDVIEELIERKFEFFEVPRAQFSRSLRTRGTLVKTDQFRRFYIGKRGDPECQEFEDYSSSPSLRMLGLPTTACIATVTSETPISEYEFRAEYEEEQVWAANYNWFKRQFVIHRPTGAVVSELITNGVQSRKTRSAGAWSCHSTQEIRNFQRAALAAAPNQWLDPVVHTDRVVPLPQIEPPQLTQLVAQDDSMLGRLAKSKLVANDGLLWVQSDVLSQIKGTSKLEISLAEVGGYPIPMVLLPLQDEILLALRFGQFPKSKYDFAIVSVSHDGRRMAVTPILLPELELYGDILRVQEIERVGDGVRIRMMDADSRNDRIKGAIDLVASRVAKAGT